MANVYVKHSPSDDQCILERLDTPYRIHRQDAQHTWSETALYEY
jgi:hypothetical protein